LFISDKQTKTVLKTAFKHLAAAAFCAFFGAVYERFSHEVYSYYMIYAFALPLGLGALPLLAMVLQDRILPNQATLGLWNAGIATLTVGSIFQGVLEIYGTTNRLIIVYPICGGIFLGLGLICYLLLCRSRRQARRRAPLDAAAGETL